MSPAEDRMHDGLSLRFAFRPGKREMLAPHELHGQRPKVGDPQMDLHVVAVRPDDDVFFHPAW